jgi:hypothetical protein
VNKILRVTLDIEVRDPTMAEVEEANADLVRGMNPDDIDEEMLVTDNDLSQTDPGELADIAAGMFDNEDAVNEAFAGSSIYVKFVGAEVALPANWIDE